MPNEVYTWNEGSAYVQTGDASSLTQFATNVNATLARGWHSYRAPYSTTWDRLETGREARLSIGQLYSQQAHFIQFEGATAGVHVHLKRLVSDPSQSGGIWLYSGVLTTIEHAGGAGQPYSISIQGTFNDWTRYGTP